MTIRAGSTIRLYSVISGRPKPTVTWHREDETPFDSRSNIVHSEFDSTLTILDCNRNDSGECLKNKVE